MIEPSYRQNRQSLILGLILSVKELFPNERLKIMHSILDGIYCELENSLLSPREVRKIEERLNEWVKADLPISCQPKEDGFFHCRINEEEVKFLFPV
ncbi:MAG: nucleoside kinase, partial [Desulfitobacteriaceae bacterium]